MQLPLYTQGHPHPGWLVALHVFAWGRAGQEQGTPWALFWKPGECKIEERRTLKKLLGVQCQETGENPPKHTALLTCRRFLLTCRRFESGLENVGGKVS